MIRNDIPVGVVRTLPLTIKLVDKLEITNQNIQRFTVFVNKKHTLAHVCRKGDDSYMRVPIPKVRKLRTEPDHILEVYFGIRIKQWMLSF